MDFFLFSDQEIEGGTVNLHVYRTTLEREVRRAEEALGEKVSITGAYKFCDLRPFFGRIYQDFVQGYDFWGYCDVDLVLGRVRRFLTDDILRKYDRFYEWGHLSIFRNNERINHIYDMPGGLYSHGETLRSPAKVTAEEHHGLNRICRKNGIAWYRGEDFADFWVCYSDLWLWHGNYPHQVFYWEDGKVWRAYIDEEGDVRTNEYVYIHWQKRKPVMEDGLQAGDAFYVTAEKLMVKKAHGAPTKEQIMRLSPLREESDRKREKRKYVAMKMKVFFKAPMAEKRIWLRQKIAYLGETGSVLQRL